MQHVDNVRTCYFSQEPIVHFPQPAPIQPVAYLGRANSKFILKLAFKVRPGSVAPVPPSQYECQVLQASERRPVTADPTLASQTVELPFTPPVVGTVVRDLPWVFQRSLKLVVYDGASSVVVTSADFAVEIYVLHHNLPDFFTNGGVPLSLLRSDTFLPKWLTAQNDTDTDMDRPLDSDDWPACVVKALFRDQRLTYNGTAAGAPKYTSQNTASMRTGCPLWLDLFMSDIVSAETKRSGAALSVLTCHTF